MQMHRKPPEEARTHEYRMRFNGEELAIVKSVARDHGLDAAAMIRMVVRAERRRLDSYKPRSRSIAH